MAGWVLPIFPSFHVCIHVMSLRWEFSLVSIWEVWKPGYIYYYSQGTQRLLVKNLPNAQLPQNCYKSLTLFLRFLLRHIGISATRVLGTPTSTRALHLQKLMISSLWLCGGSIYSKIVEETHKRTTLIDCCEGCHTAIDWSRL
jgi:hypothetical protein